MWHLSVVGPRRGRKRKGRLPPVLSYGEDVSIKKSGLHKRVRAVRGFTLPVLQSQRRRTLRRQFRDSSKSKRRPKRGKRTNRRKGRRSARHWSEKRLRRLRKNSYSYRRIMLGKTFSRKLRGKFNSRFASVRLHRAESSRLSTFFKRRTLSTALEQTRVTNIRPAAATLDAVSCLCDRERV